MITTPGLTIRAIIKERYRYLTIIVPPPHFKGKTFQVPVELMLRYTDALRELEILESKIIFSARKQDAYPPLQIKPGPVRYRLEEGEIHAFDDDGNLTIKK